MLGLQAPPAGQAEFQLEIPILCLVGHTPVTGNDSERSERGEIKAAGTRTESGTSRNQTETRTREY